MALMPKRAPGLGKIEWETVYHGDSLKKKRHSRQNRPPSTGLGKFHAEPVYLGHHAFFARAHAKTLGQFGEIPKGNRLSWRFRKKKRESRQNPQLVWGNSKGKPFIMAIVKRSEIGLAKSFGLAKPFGSAKQEGIALVVDRSKVEEVKDV